ncbi:MAG TPA: rhomboid family intramembrane serine protease [Thermoanaerobaculia bacterium]|nr:rhomboid family intramembrane serine protease [Thermoanaerobaculia bacterium]
MFIKRLKRNPATVSLLAVIAFVFLHQLTSGALLDGSRMRALGAITDDVFATKEYGRLLKAIFLHGNLLHWLANSWALLQLGSLFEEMFGTPRFVMVWFATGIAASAVSALNLETGGMSVGASGAIFGVIGAFILAIGRSPFWRNHPISAGLRAQLLFWAVVNIAFGFFTPFTDNAAHIGGFIAGLLVGILPQRARRDAASV